MAKSIWNAADRNALLDRFDTLPPNRPPKWGRMTVSQMVSHCTLPILSTMGEFPAAPIKTVFRFWPVNKLIIHVLPWPRGAPTAPEFIPQDGDDLPERIAALRAAVEKFAARGPAQPFEPHVAFGALSARDWGVLFHRHLDHHLTQFGA